MPMTLWAFCTFCKASSCRPALCAVCACARNSLTWVCCCGVSIEPCCFTLSSSAAIWRGHWLASTGDASPMRKAEAIKSNRMSYSHKKRRLSLRWSSVMPLGAKLIDSDLQQFVTNEQNSETNAGISISGTVKSHSAANDPPHVWAFYSQRRLPSHDTVSQSHDEIAAPFTTFNQGDTAHRLRRDAEKAMHLVHLLLKHYDIYFTANRSAYVRVRHDSGLSGLPYRSIACNLFRSVRVDLCQNRFAILDGSAGFINPEICFSPCW